jgi:parvulin-like peptidyl-prolyl isomerase
MAKQKAVPPETKKHIARAERERRQRRIILAIGFAVGIIVIVLVGVGIYDSYFVKPNKPVAVVNGEEIPAGHIETRVRWAQRTLVAQMSSQIELLNAFADQPELTQTLQGQILELQAQLSNPALLAQDVFDQMTTEALFRQEAERRGITVSAEEIDGTIYELFDFYPDGTPTPSPTSGGESSEEGESGATELPQPIPTAYTREDFNEDYKNFVDSLRDFRIKEADFRDLVRNQLLQVKVQEAFQAETDIPENEEQVLVQHLIVQEEAVADEVFQRYKDGQPWEELVLEFSEDTSTNETAGEIGWLSLEELQSQFGQQGLIIFASPLGQVIGPIESSIGFHLIIVDGREDRPLSEFALQRLTQTIYGNWVQSLRTEAEIEIIDGWEEYLPPPFAPAAG